MASKQNDLMLNILANPHMNLGDFQSVGLTANNTSLEDENVYKNLKTITENPLFQNASGEFDEVKFHLKYMEAAKAMEIMSLDTEGFKATYSKYNIFAPSNQIENKPQFELTKALNPDRLTKSMITLGQSGPRTKSAAEIAQSQKVYNSETGEWMDTPENMFSFNKLFTDFKGFFTDNFEATKVLALYEEDIDINGKKRGEIGFDENLIEHQKGEYMLNDNGTYYYRTLKKGENVYGKQVLHYSDILTREGSALNAVDFLDSDDIEKTPFGSFVKSASLVGSFFLPYVGPAIAGATIFQQAAGLGATLGKIALGSDDPTMNWIEGLVKSTNPMETRSEHSQQLNWTYENLLGMAGDVIAQLYQQRMIFKYSPYVFKGKWGTSEKNLELLRNKFIADIQKSKGSILGNKKIGDPTKAAKISEANAVSEAGRMVEEYMKDYYKAGEHLSKAYMTILTVNDIYGEAKEAGAEDFDAALITMGYAAMEYALLSTDIGKWILPELRANRLENRAILNAMTKETKAAFAKARAEAAMSEEGKRNYIKTLLNYGKQFARGEFAVGLGKRASVEGGSGLLKAGVASLFSGAMAEAIEETSEEVLADISRVLFNGLQSLLDKDTRIKPFENMFDRYTMSFLGGFLGGGVSSATMDFSAARRAVNMTYNQAMQLVIWKARNNELGDLYKIIDSKDEIGNKNLSTKLITDPESGETVWKQGDANDNQDLAIKLNLRRQLQLIQNTLDAHGGNLTDQSLLDAQTLRDIRFRVLHDSTTAGLYIQSYNELVTELVDTTLKLRELNSPAARAEEGETDKADDKSPELEAKRKKLEDRIKEIDKLLEDFLQGKLAPLFMTSALLETTPYISAPFMTSTFRLYAERKAKTKFEDIPKAELDLYLIEYLNYIRTTKKDDLKLATEGYLILQKLIKLNFEEAKNLAEAQANDTELTEFLTKFTHTLSGYSQNLLNMDDDTWLEDLQNFAQSAQVGQPLIDKMRNAREVYGALLNIKSEYNKGIKGITDSRDARLVELLQQLNDVEQARGTTGDEIADNTIAKINSEIEQINKDFDEKKSELDTKLNEVLTEHKTTYDTLELDAKSNYDKVIQEVLNDGKIQAAQNLADKILSMGYINGAIKGNILALLNSIKLFISDYRKQLSENVDLDTATDEEINNFNKIDSKLGRQLVELTGDEKTGKVGKIELIEKLPYTPILQNLDTFALNVNGGNVSQLLETLGNQINSNRSALLAFTLQDDAYRQLNEAIRTVDLYIAALEGARTDNVDPFRVLPNALGKSLDRSDVWGINKVLNEVHAKSPKIENDTWEDLPEIDGKTADMMINDALGIKKLLYVYKRLYNINEGQKLNVQTRVATRTTYLIYDRIRRLLSNNELDKDFAEETAKLRQAFAQLEFLKEQVTENSNDYNINLNKEDQIKLEKERIALGDAIYDFFNSTGITNDPEKIKLFLKDKFNLLDPNTNLLTEGAESLDETSIIGFIASNAAIKTSDFYNRFKDVISENDIAPIISQELGVQLHLANILNGDVITAFNKAYRELLIEQFNAADFDLRVEFLTKFGESKEVAQLFASKIGSKYYLNHDSVIQFDNITFIDGIPGAGN